MLSFDSIATAHIKQPFHGTVCRYVLGDDGQRLHPGAALELVAQCFRQIAHGIKITGTALVDPAE